MESIRLATAREHSKKLLKPNRNRSGSITVVAASFLVLFIHVSKVAPSDTTTSTTTTAATPTATNSTTTDNDSNNSSDSGNSTGTPPTKPRLKELTIGYLPIDKPINGYQLVTRQYRVISGALTYAIEVVNNQSIIPGHRLGFVWNDTHGSVAGGVRAVADQWRRGVDMFLGPEETCDYEGRLAAAWNLPMLSYVSRCECWLSTFAELVGCGVCNGGDDGGGGGGGGNGGFGGDGSGSDCRGDNDSRVVVLVLMVVLIVVGVVVVVTLLMMMMVESDISRCKS